jgi:hypothetical protein
MASNEKEELLTREERDTMSSGMTISESDRIYRTIFYVGSVWNFCISIGMFLLVGSLPSMLAIAPPRYPVFIYFNLMSVFFFGCFQWIVAKNLHRHRSVVKLLMCAKLAMGGLYLYSLFFDAPAKELMSFLAPGMVVDFIFGLIFWRFLVYSRAKQ